jgi:hypothetical protein
MDRRPHTNLASNRLEKADLVSGIVGEDQFDVHKAEMIERRQQRMQKS